jgi:hypothetical protein
VQTSLDAGSKKVACMKHRIVISKWKTKERESTKKEIFSFILNGDETWDFICDWSWEEDKK